MVRENVKEITVVTTPKHKSKGKQVLPTAEGQENGITILLRLKDYKVGEVQRGEEKGPFSIT